MRFVFRLAIVLACLSSVYSVRAQDFRKPYAGVKPASGSRPLLVILLKPRDDRFLDDGKMSVFGVSADGHVGQTQYGFKRDSNDPSGWYAPRSYTKMPAGVRFAAGPAVVNHPDGTLQSVFAAGTDGRIYQTWTPREGDVSLNWRPWSPLPSNVLLTGQPSALEHSKGRALTLFARGRDSRIYTIDFRRGTNGGWGTWVSLPGSAKFQEDPAGLLSADGTRLIVFAARADGIVYRRTRNLTDNRGWGKWIALTANVLIKGGLSVVRSPLEGGSILAARGRDGRLYYTVVNDNGAGPHNRWLRLPSGDFPHGATLANRPYGLIAYAPGRDGALYYSWVILPFPGGGWHPWKKIDTGADRFFGAVAASPPLAHLPSPKRFREMFFGAAPSVADFYRRNSYGNFSFVEAAVTPWLTAVDDPSTPNQDESSYAYLNGPAEEAKAAYVLRAAADLAGFNFAYYDQHPRDGVVTEDELCVYWVYPGDESARGRETEPKVVPVRGLPGNGGVKLNYLVRGGTKASVATAAHELGHEALGLPDLYAAKKDGYLGVGDFSTMSNEGSGNFLDPWSRMKLGWLRPTVITSSREINFLDSKQYGDAAILYDPRRGTREYFIVENREPDPVYEPSIQSRGLAVWHIQETHDDANDGHWGRKTIRLKWAGGAPDAVNDANDHALFNASDPRALYDLTDKSAPANSRWRDGSDSGIRIRGIPPAGPTMKVRLVVP